MQSVLAFDSLYCLVCPKFLRLIQSISALALGVEGLILGDQAQGLLSARLTLSTHSALSKTIVCPSFLVVMTRGIPCPDRETDIYRERDVIFFELYNSKWLISFGDKV